MGEKNGDSPKSSYVSPQQWEGKKFILKIHQAALSVLPQDKLTANTSLKSSCTK